MSMSNIDLTDDEERESPLTNDRCNLDLMLVPGLAFTTSGKRLGR
jgi:5-formyltetrahydrofolate cyclo-ligase